jgi:hypothetical protein
MLELQTARRCSGQITFAVRVHACIRIGETQRRSICGPVIRINGCSMRFRRSVASKVDLGADPRSWTPAKTIAFARASDCYADAGSRGVWPGHTGTPPPSYGGTGQEQWQAHWTARTLAGFRRTRGRFLPATPALQLAVTAERRRAHRAEATRGRPRTVDGPEEEGCSREIVEQANDLTLEEHRERLRQRCDPELSTSTISRALACLDLPRKN